MKKSEFRKIEVSIERNDDSELLFEELYDDKNLPDGWTFIKFGILGGFLKVKISKVGVER